MQDGDALAEALFQPRGEDRRERDLGHEQQRLLSSPHRLAHQLDVDLGLAAAGDAFEQKRRERAERARDRFDGGASARRVADLADAGRIEAGEKASSVCRRGGARCARCSSSPAPTSTAALTPAFSSARTDISPPRDAAARPRCCCFARQAAGHRSPGRRSGRSERLSRPCKRSPMAMRPASRSRAIDERASSASSASANGSGRRAQLVDAAADRRRGSASDASARDHRRHRRRAPARASARGHVRRQRHAQHLAERRDVVLGGPAAKLDDLRQQRRLFVIEHRADRLDLLRLGGGLVEQPDDEAGVRFAPNGTSTREPRRTRVAQRGGIAYVNVPCTATGTAISANSRGPPPRTRSPAPPSPSSCPPRHPSSPKACAADTRGDSVGMTLMPL